MELKEFVKTAVQDIIAALTEANEGLQGFQTVGTSNHNKVSGLPTNIIQDHNGGIYSVVDFDIAVTSAKSGGAEAGISIIPFQIGGRGEVSSETVSRIRFSTLVRPK